MGSNTNTVNHSINNSTTTTNSYEEVSNEHNKNFDITREYQNKLDGDWVGGSGLNDLNNVISDGTQCFGASCDSLILLLVWVINTYNTTAKWLNCSVVILAYKISKLTKLCELFICLSADCSMYFTNINKYQQAYKSIWI